MILSRLVGLLSQSLKKKSRSIQPKSIKRIHVGCADSENPGVQNGSGKTKFAEKSFLNPFKHCCSIPPVTSDYTPVGTMEKWGGMNVYTSGPKNAKHAILVFYDIFGYCDNTKQFCDVLAKASNYRVVLPDFFLDNPPKQEMLFGLERPQMMEWLLKNASLPVILPLVNQVEEQLKVDGAVSAVFVGFCWGAKMAAQLSATHPFFVGASMVHPSMVNNADADASTIPILALPSKQEPDMTEYMEILYKKPFGSKCQHYRFDDMEHGFCASGADFGNPRVSKRVNEAIKLTVKFFDICFEDETVNKL